MSDTILSITPTDPRWQPDRAAGEATVAVLRGLVAPDAPDEITVTWHDMTVFVDCGANLERIGCPRCGTTVDERWWADRMGALSHAGGFTSLVVRVPCCDAETSLDALDYDWPCAFARFAIAARNPGRGWLTPAELDSLAAALGHPVRQVMAHL